MDHQRKSISENICTSEKGLVTSSRPLLLFAIISIKRDWVRKQKRSLTFFEDFLIILLQNILFKKEILECIGYILGYLQNLSSGLGLVSGTQFQHIFK